ncbi:MAG: OsmC family protein [Deltaproteobacteria bacterium]|nr:OsmC family protein [Deltaproteobacteria bacterium]
MEFEISFPGGLRVDANVFGQVVPTDQPVMAGGSGSAPAPFTLFLASIGTCAGIYVLHFCKTRGIPTEGVRILQRIAGRPDQTLGAVELEIEVPATFPEKYHSAILRAADQCAVKKVMENPPAFNTRVSVV